MYAPGTLLEIVGDAATQRLVLSPGAYFNAGHVRQMPGRLLLSYQVWGDRDTDAGVGALTVRNTAGSLVAVATVPASGLANVTSAGVMNLSGHGAWMPDGNVVTLSPNTPLAGSGACAVDAASASRIEIRSASALEGCVRAFGTDFPTDDAEIQTHVAGNTLWAVRSNDISVRAFDLTTGTSRRLDLPDSPPDLSPNVMLAPAPDGTLFVGFSSRGVSATPEGDMRAGGYVIRLRSGPTGIAVLGERWVSGNVAGLDVAPDGTVYVLSTVDAPAMLCPRDGVVPPTFMPMGSARLLTALDFGL